MGYCRFDDVLRHLRWAARPPGTAEAEDWRLLDRFLDERDETAFETLVRRHGPMVLGVCGRVLHDAHAAEDAFQATFLVLVRKGRALHRRERLAGWLHGVAYRTACKARTTSARRRARERQAEVRLETLPADDAVWCDLRPLLDEELNRLPERYRLPVVLCYLQGRTLTEAATDLGWPPGTVAGRLARARDLLRKRLTGRGVTLAGALPAGRMTEALPARLLAATLRVARALAEGPARLNEIATPAVAELTKGVLHAMFVTKLKTLVVAILAVGALGTGVLAYPRLVGQQPVPDPEQRPPAAVQAPGPARPDVAQQPSEEEQAAERALHTFGEAKVKALLDRSRASGKLKALLKERYDAALTESGARLKEFYAGRGTLDICLGASLRLLEAERELSTRREDQIAALENHRKRMAAIEELNQARYDAGRIPIQDLSQSKYYRIQAEIWIERFRAE
jgi:RNA polymerase sigma factor (sigma-70 family)